MKRWQRWLLRVGFIGIIGICIFKLDSMDAKIAAMIFVTLTWIVDSIPEHI